MREIEEEEYNRLVGEDIHRQVSYRGSALAIRAILDTVQVMEESIQNSEICIYNDGNTVHILLHEISPEEVITQQRAETPYLSMIEDVIHCFEDGHERNGWEWRSPESISRETNHPLDEVQSILNDNEELFAPSENGRKYRYVNL
jgi:hypothetical protein